MCGIAGVLNPLKKNKQDHHSFEVKTMMNTLTHRGPDDSGISECDYGVMGHTRLSVIDIEHGHQPMYSHDERYVLVFNGEIYNYIELRLALIQDGVSFETFSDTEVLLNLLITKGEKAISELNGMFAFCFLDTLTGEWIIARDHFGIKPLYLLKHNDALYFSSEIKALMSLSGVDPAVNNKGLGHYFTFQFCLGEETLFSGVQKIEPGYYHKGRGNNLEKSVKYWEIDYTIDDSHTEEFFIEKLQAILSDSLKLQVRSDVPLGAYLSGGLDSSAISVLASDVLKSGIPVFTGKFAEGPEYDESHHAKVVSDQINGSMIEIVPTAQEFADLIPKIIYSLDEPLAGPGVFPQYMVSKEASRHVKVILGGQGGDEIFGGYARYLVAYLEQGLKQSIMGGNEEGEHSISLSSIIPNLELLAQYKPMLSSFWKQGLFSPMDSRYFRLVDRSPDMAAIVCNDVLEQFDRNSVFSDFQQIFNNINSSSYLNKMANFDLKTLLPALLHVEDRVSMASSIESRVPLLDPRIVELVAQVPPEMKFQGGKTKALFNAAMREKLPPQIINRKDKMGFPVPLTEWMKKGPVRDFILDTLLSKASLNRGIYKKEVLENIASFSGVGARQLWGILSLELWHQAFIDK